MKKNILTIVIMAASLINLVLSAVLIFSVMPAMNKTSNLVDKVASVIDLEIEDADAAEAEYTIEDLVPFDIAYEKSANIRLQPSSDGEAHYVVIDGITISYNKNADDYSKVSGMITENTAYVEDIVKETIGEYSFDNMDQNKIKQEAVKKLQEKYNTECIVDVILKNFLPA